MGSAWINKRRIRIENNQKTRIKIEKTIRDGYHQKTIQLHEFNFESDKKYALNISGMPQSMHTYSFEQDFCRKEVQIPPFLLERLTRHTQLKNQQLDHSSIFDSSPGKTSLATNNTNIETIKTEEMIIARNMIEIKTDNFVENTDLKNSRISSEITQETEPSPSFLKPISQKPNLIPKHTLLLLAQIRNSLYETPLRMSTQDSQLRVLVDHLKSCL